MNDNNAEQRSVLKWTIGMKIGSAFALALATLVGVGFVSYQSTAKLTATAAWVTHTYQVLEKVESLFNHLLEVQRGERGYVITGEERFLDPYVGALGKIDPDIKELRHLTADNPRQQRRLDALEPLIKTELAVLKAAVEIRKAKGLDEAVREVKTGQGKKAMDEIRQVIDEMLGEENGLMKTRSDEAQASASGAVLTIAGGTLAAFVVLGLAGFFLTRSIARPLKGLAASAQRIAAGDLNVTVAVDSRQDEIGVLLRAFGRMTDNLKGMAVVAGKIAASDLRVKVQPQSEKDLLGTAFATMVGNLQRLAAEMTGGVNVLVSSASEIVASTSQLASSASQSAAAVAQTTATVDEVRQTAQLASQKARQVSETAQKAVQSSQSGRKSADDVNAGMDRIRQQMEAIAASMGRLSEHSQVIGQIIATVEDLAVQSNLLAVNAAIEAAKAGEHGKGFGVVAQEVKSLAAQSRQATSEVRTILGEIQKATTAAVLATGQGSQAVEAGSRQTELASEAIQALAGGVNEAAQAATQIAASSQQQMVGLDQVAGAMESIKQASTQNMASARQLESAARDLNDLGQRLKQMVGSYSL